MNFKLKLVKPKTIQLKQKNLVVVEPAKEWVTVKSTEEEQVVLPTGKKVISRVTVEPIQLEETNTIPTKTEQIISASENYDAIKKVTVEAIPDLYVDTSDATAKVGDIVKGKSAYVDGEKLDGTLNVINEVKDIIFIDYKGNILATYGLDELPLAELPEAPQFEGLTFTGYNSSLEEINAIEKGRYHIIGTCYEPTDNNTHIFYDLGEFVFERTYAVSILISSTTGGQIDWGDGIVDSFGTGNSTLAHDYSNLPRQQYEAVISADNLTFRAYAFVGGSSNNKDSLIAEIWLSSNGVSGSANFCRNLSTLKYVIYPLTNVIASLFLNCYNLKAFVLQKNISNYNMSDGLQSCYSLEIYSLPINITTIYDNNSLFRTCYKLKYHQYLKNITQYGGYYYNNTHALEEIIFPDSVVEISGYFGGNGLIKLELNEGLQTIGNYAFSSAYKLKQVTIPSTVNAINQNAFSAAYSLTDIWMKPTIPPTLGNTGAFYRHENLKIYVPLESLEAYKTATNWTVLTDYMEGY